MTNPDYQDPNGPEFDALLQDERVKQFLINLAQQYAQQIVQNNQSIKLAALDFASKMNPAPATPQQLIESANVIIDYFKEDDSNAESGTEDQDLPQ